MTTVAYELRGLFELVTDAGPPTAARLHAHFQARGLAIRPAGPNLEGPAWASVVTPEDSFVELGGAVAGIRFGEDPRGYGAYAELAVTATLAEIEAITGPLASMAPRVSPDRALFVRVEMHGHRIAVYVAHAEGAVRSVTLQF